MINTSLTFPATIMYNRVVRYSYLFMSESNSFVPARKTVSFSRAFFAINRSEMRIIMLAKYLLIFFVSMVPIVELRGAIPIAVHAGLPLLPSYIISVIGNMIPVPFIYLFARKILLWGADKKYIGKFFNFCLEKGERGGKKLKEKAGRGLFVALLLFVGIPLPGTGAWTGTLAASFLNMDFKPTIFAAMGGVLLAGLIMGAASIGLFSAIAAIF